MQKDRGLSGGGRGYREKLGEKKGENARDFDGNSFYKSKSFSFVLFKLMQTVYSRLIALF